MMIPQCIECLGCQHLHLENAPIKMNAANIHQTINQSINQSINCVYESDQATSLRHFLYWYIKIPTKQ